MARLPVLLLIPKIFIITAGFVFKRNLEIVGRNKLGSYFWSEQLCFFVFFLFFLKDHLNSFKFNFCLLVY